MRSTYKKTPRENSRRFLIKCLLFLTLTGFEAALRLVDDVDAAFTAHDTTVAVTLLERAE
jgi:hypothetical protein